MRKEEASNVRTGGVTSVAATLRTEMEERDIGKGEGGRGTKRAAVSAVVVAARPVCLCTHKSTSERCSDSVESWMETRNAHYALSVKRCAYRCTKRREG